MTNFEIGCAKFKEKYGYLTVKQLRVLVKIKQERKIKNSSKTYYDDTQMEINSDFAMAHDWGSQ